MSKEVSNNQVIQAITELSSQLKETKAELSRQLEETKSELSKQIKETEKRLTEKIDILDAKVSVLSESLLTTQAEVKILKNAK